MNTTKIRQQLRTITTETPATTAQEIFDAGLDALAWDEPALSVQISEQAKVHGIPAMAGELALAISFADAEY